MPAEAGPDAVVARLTLAAARLKALQDETAQVMDGLERSSAGDVRVRRAEPPPLHPHARLQEALAALAGAQGELARARERLEAAERGLATLPRREERPAVPRG